MSASVSAGQQGMALDIFNAVNEARTQPEAFWNKHQTRIEIYSARYAQFIRSARPAPALAWDPGLETMARQIVDDQNLNPSYTGTNSLCGFANGVCGGTVSKDPISYVCDYYTNVHDPGTTFLGIYFNRTQNGYAFEWGSGCSEGGSGVSYEAPAPDTAGVEMARINTGVRAAYMTQEERRMLMEINFVRAYPRQYATLVAQFMEQESKTWGLSQASYDAGMELIAELNAMKPLPVLQPSECVYQAARLHGLDCQRRGFFDHQGSDKSMPWDRILRQCPDLKQGNENGASNPALNPRMPLMSLLLDEGISSRGHRYNILDPNWTYAACFRVPDDTYGFIWVQKFAY
ncbi:MAG: hypothetical protein EAZ89_01940 [Bacteroidetes bacterium]|nr:MAG: hypothetical protein EAZ89_01940 [Bacteroidota bacterium]